VTTTIKDDAGNFVPWACNRIDYKIEGPVKLLGFDNGDPLDVTTHRETYRKTFNGLSMGIFQATKLPGPIEITAAGILGRTIFPKSTTIAISMDRISLSATPGKIHKDAEFGIIYSVNGSKPVKYTGPFVLTESATIEAIITKDGKPFMTSKNDFTKGPLPRVTDPRLVTVEDEDETFDGPRDKEVAGEWILKASQRRGGQLRKENDRLFLFDPSGSVFTFKGNEKNLYGYWWYDYPDDVFENPADSGVGKLFMYVTDQMCSMKLDSQKAKKLVIKSRFKTWYFERKQNHE